MRAPRHLLPYVKGLGAGEASALALALENPGSRVLIDEQFGRAYAATLGIEVTGTLGVLLEAKQSGLIPVVAPIINQMRALGMWLRAHLESMYDTGCRRA